MTTYTGKNLALYTVRTLTNLSGITGSRSMIDLGLVSVASFHLFETHLNSALIMLAREGRATTDGLYHHAYKESEAHGEGTYMYKMWDAILFQCYAEIERSYGRTA